MPSRLPSVSQRRQGTTSREDEALREALFLAYAAAMLLAASAVSRMRPLQMPVGVAAAPGLVGLICLSVLIAGGGIGCMVPTLIAEAVPPGGSFSALRAPTDLGALGRLVQILGAACGAWIAVRGLWLWTLMTVVGVALYATFHALAWISLGFW